MPFHAVPCRHMPSHTNYRSRWVEIWRHASNFFRWKRKSRWAFGPARLPRLLRLLRRLPRVLHRAPLGATRRAMLRGCTAAALTTCHPSPRPTTCQPATPPVPTLTQTHHQPTKGTTCAIQQHHQLTSHRDLPTRTWRQLVLAKLTRSFSLDPATGASLRSRATRWCDVQRNPRERPVLLVLRNATRQFARPDTLTALLRGWLADGLVPGATRLRVVRPAQMSFYEQVRAGLSDLHPLAPPPIEPPPSPPSP